MRGTILSSLCLSCHWFTHGGSRTQLEHFRKSVSLFPSEHLVNLDSAFPSCSPVNEGGRGKGGEEGERGKEEEEGERGREKGVRVER